MPKLSAYVGHPSDTTQQPVSSQQKGAAGGGETAARQAQQQQQQQQQLAQPLPQQNAASLIDPHHDAAAAKLQADFAKRLQEHGPRNFRWPDGSLRPERPPPNPHAVASRARWAELAHHCRTHGGDRAYERHGQSLRYGIGVPHDQHAAYLALVGLQPETDAAGRRQGEASGLAGPLQDPQHCFNTYYKEGAEAVFKDRRGRLL